MDAAGPDLDHDLHGHALRPAEGYPVQASHTGVDHLGCDRVGSVACEPVNTGADDEVRPEVPREAEQLVDVALAVADMDEAPGSPSNSTDRRRLSSHRQLSLPSIGTRVGLTTRLSAAVPRNFDRVQTFSAVTPSGTPPSVTRGSCA
jgi:hypothetical protein